ncbi:sulfatase-modifying factor [Babesia caballi]|uniref:Sulfatase-modifying factor n=1 Tax=Babesia caballi TaxID=5871 RepID=A0AAV4LPA1_BABCB|nr:sulfatase-modifying factor [Babesia caballi]
MKVFSIKGHSSNFSKDIYDPDAYDALANQPEQDPVLPPEGPRSDGADVSADPASKASTRRRRSGWSPDN